MIFRLRETGGSGSFLRGFEGGQAIWGSEKLDMGEMSEEEKYDFFGFCACICGEEGGGLCRSSEKDCHAASPLPCSRFATAHPQLRWDAPPCGGDSGRFPSACAE